MELSKYSETETRLHIDITSNEFQVRRQKY